MNSIVVDRTVELIILGTALIMLLNACCQGCRWVSLLLSAIVFGFIVEYTLLHKINPPDYTYPKTYLLKLFDVPLWVPVGWGCIIYCCAWTTEALSIRAPIRPLAAGFLALNADLSFDPVAADYGLWIWKIQSYAAQCDLTAFAADQKSLPACHGFPDRACEAGGVFGHRPAQLMTTFDIGAAPHLSYYDVPFHNFIAWFAIVALFVLATEILFAITRNWNGKRCPGRISDWPMWVEIVVPIVSIAVAFGLLLLVRFSMVNSHVGEDTSYDVYVLAGIMLLSIILLLEVLLGARRNHATNLPTLMFPLLFHVLAFVLSLNHFGRKPTLPVAIVMNFAVGLLAFSWPFQRRLAERFGLLRLYPAPPD